MPTKALFFDFDGLILDTETPEVEEWQATFERHGAEFPLDYFLWAVGRGAEQITERPLDLFMKAVPHLVREEVEAEYNQRRLHRIHTSPPREGVVDLLDAAATEGLALYVVSSSRRVWVEPHLERLGLRSRFIRTVCADDAPRAKPHPDLYLEALRVSDTAPDEAIAFEDSANGTAAAKAAGIRVVAVPNPVTRHLDLSHADHQFNSFTEFTLHQIR